MSLAIYRKYRPRSFREVIGQEAIKTTLQSEIENGCLAHAFLFCGPRGIGKTTMARLLAKAVNCKQRKQNESEPCNQCSVCREIQTGRSLDIIEMDAASHTKVEEVRESIIANSKITTASKNYKVFIIDEAHMLSMSSFNALLKTLEEPPSKVIFILATTEVQKIPETIISRCQRFDFKKVGFNDLLERLKWICEREGKQVELDVLRQVIRVSGGHVRDSLSLLGQILSFPQTEIIKENVSWILPDSDFCEVVKLLKALSRTQTKEALELVQRLSEKGGDFLLFMDHVIEVLRKLLLISQGIEDFLEYTENHQKELKELSSEIPVSYLISMINILISRRTHLNLTGMESLPLEMAVIEICLLKEKNQDMGCPGDKGGKRGGNSFKRSGKKIISEIKAIKNKTKGVIKSSVAKAVGESKKEPAREIKVDDSVVSEPSAGESLSVVTLEEIRSKWGKILESLREKNQSVLMLVKNAEILGVKGNQLDLGFKFEFHKDRLEQPVNKNILESVLKEIYGKEIQVVVIVDEKIKIPFNEEKPRKEKIVLEDILEDFGGRIVE